MATSTLPTQKQRIGKVHRKTGETDITVDVNIDGTGHSEIVTHIGFFDHMLDALARHSMCDISIHVKGDTHVDNHHTIEDTGIALGEALRKALGDKKGILRFGQALVPLDEALCEVAIDLSGRPFLAFDGTFPVERIGQMESEMIEEFFRAFVFASMMTAHIHQKAGKNAHHIAESMFKSVARALRMATTYDPRAQGIIPSTKGSL